MRHGRAPFGLVFWGQAFSLPISRVRLDHGHLAIFTVVFLGPAVDGLREEKPRRR